MTRTTASFSASLLARAKLHYRTRQTRLRIESLETRIVPANPPIYAIGTDAGTTGRVRVFDASTNQQIFSIAPFGQNYRGGVRVAIADVTGDGKVDLIV